MSNIRSWRGILNRFLSILAVCFCLTAASCASSPSIYTFVLEGGIQQDFIRPTEFKNHDIEVSVDFTIHSKDGMLTDPVTVNFSIIGKPFGKNQAEKIEFFVEADGESFAVQNIVTLFRSTDPLSLRRSGKIDEAGFRKAVYASERKLVFVSPDGSRTEFVSEKLNSALDSLQGIID